MYAGVGGGQEHHASSYYIGSVLIDCSTIKHLESDTVLPIRYVSRI